jgi:hypothetical protein
MQGVNMDWILLVIGLLAGGAGGAGIVAGLSKNKDPKIIEKTIEVDSKLTDQAILQVPCSADFITKHTAALCREMWCRMHMRSGNQSNKASSQECEAISNANNKRLIYESCLEYARGDDNTRKQCIEFFDRRI